MRYTQTTRRVRTDREAWGARSHAPEAVSTRGASVVESLSDALARLYLSEGDYPERMRLLDHDARLLQFQPCERRAYWLYR